MNNLTIEILEGLLSKMRLKHVDAARCKSLSDASEQQRIMLSGKQSAYWEIICLLENHIKTQKERQDRITTPIGKTVDDLQNDILALVEWAQFVSDCEFCPATSHATSELVAKIKTKQP